MDFEIDNFEHIAIPMQKKLTDRHSLKSAIPYENFKLAAPWLPLLAD